MELPCRRIDDYDVHHGGMYLLFFDPIRFFLNCDIHVKYVIKNQCYI